MLKMLNDLSEVEKQEQYLKGAFWGFFCGILSSILITPTWKAIVGCIFWSVLFLGAAIARYRIYKNKKNGESKSG